MVPCPSPGSTPGAQAPAVASSPAPAIASLAPAPLRVNLPKPQLNAGTCTRLVVSGGVPPYAAAATAGNVAATVQPDGSIIVAAIRNGRDAVTISDAASATLTVPVLVAPDAGVLPASVALRFAGGGLSAEFAAVVLAAELARRAHVQPGARVAAVSARLLPAGLSTTAPWSGTIPVTLSGQDRWRDVQGSVPVQIDVVTLPPLEPAQLFYSDDPETILGNQAGVVFRTALSAQTPTTRLFAYHEFETVGRQLFLVLRSAGTSHVQLVGDVAGPSYTTYAGHTMTVRYLQARRLGRSTIATVDADPVVIEIGSRSEAQRLVTAIYDLRLLDGDAIDVFVVAGFASGDPTPLALIAAPPALPIVQDLHDRSGVYPLDALGPIMLSAAVTDGKYRRPAAIGTSAVVGAWAVPPIVGKRYLGGDYGVVRPFRLTMTNATDQPGTIYFYVAPSGGGATTSILFDGDGLTADGKPKIVEPPCLVGSKTAPAFTDRYLLRPFTIAPTRGGAPVVVTGEFMTDGGSTYPAELGLALDPPLPLPANSMCVATPTPAPIPASPFPSPSPAPSASP